MGETDETNYGETNWDICTCTHWGGERGTCLVRSAIDCHGWKKDVLVWKSMRRHWSTEGGDNAPPTASEQPGLLPLPSLSKRQHQKTSRGTRTRAHRTGEVGSWNCRSGGYRLVFLNEGRMKSNRSIWGFWQFWFLPKINSLYDERIV